ncbi:hypothetical protein D5S17_35590 [Pseudonocardiaceae bacterium YIM PH 21723]|nr:hypothetical protein D5S17_35590 [Pseudonocardiaceae bacterium YIM PH 21723]
MSDQPFLGDLTIGPVPVQAHLDELYRFVGSGRIVYLGYDHEPFSDRTISGPYMRYELPGNQVLSLHPARLDRSEGDWMEEGQEARAAWIAFDGKTNAQVDPADWPPDTYRAVDSLWNTYREVLEVAVLPTVAKAINTALNLAVTSRNQETSPTQTQAAPRLDRDAVPETGRSVLAPPAVGIHSTGPIEPGRTR